MGNSHSSRGLSREEVNRAKMRFERVTTKEQPFLSKKKFTDLLGNPSYAEGLFNFIDTDRDGTVSCKEICEEIKLFRASKTPGSKLRVLFSYYDSDHDGRISPSELAAAMRVACGQDLSDSQIDKDCNTTYDDDDDLSYRTVEHDKHWSPVIYGRHLQKEH